MPVENPLCEPTLNSLLESSSLKWLFVGGKGGVGKTTTSCSLATLLARTPRKTSEGAQRPRRVLIVSTDPAHNVSDAFGQAFTSVPTPVTGVENLDAIEIDPSHIFGSSGQQSTDSCSAGSMSQLKAVLQQAATVLPGIDEISVLVEIMKYVQQLQYDTVVFDTAPTGHTLRLLALPQNLNSTLEKVFEIQGIQQVINMASSFLTGATNSEGANIENLTETLSRWRGHIREIQEQFTDHSRTAFVCVCIPEFLPVYETERLVQELSKYNINCEHIVVNQVVRKSKSDEGTCRMCDARTRTQSKYLKQIYDLYEDFHVVEMPLNFDEVRGPDALIRFSRYLSEPYNVEVHGYL